MKMGPLAMVALLLLFGLTACDAGPSDASGSTAADAASAAVRALPAVDAAEATYTPGKFGSSDPSPTVRATITADPTITRDQLLSVLRTFGQSRGTGALHDVQTYLTVTMPIPSSAAPMSRRTFRQDRFDITDEQLVDAVDHWAATIAEFGPYVSVQIEYASYYHLIVDLALLPGADDTEVAAAKARLQESLGPGPTYTARVQVQP